MAPPPFKQLAREFREGTIVPFLGAGASTFARPPGESWKESVEGFPPLGGELARLLAEDCEFPAVEDRLKGELARVASYYQYGSLGRTSLRERLHEVFARPYAHGGLHEYLAASPKALLIITTNYDTLIERAFDAIGRSYHLVVYPTDRPDAAGSVLWRRAEDPGAGFVACELGKLKLLCKPDEPSVIYKIHGTVDPTNPDNDQFVITEEDYVAFLGRMTEKRAIPDCFLLPLQKRRLLFLGYGLEDWNFRVLLRSLSSVDLSGRPAEDFVHWAIQRTVDDIERQIWSRQKVNIHDMDLAGFVERLKQVVP